MLKRKDEMEKGSDRKRRREKKDGI